jgi:hypothetical protein
MVDGLIELPRDRVATPLTSPTELLLRSAFGFEFFSFFCWRCILFFECLFIAGPLSLIIQSHHDAAFTQKMPNSAPN